LNGEAFSAFAAGVAATPAGLSEAPAGLVASVAGPDAVAAVAAGGVEADWGLAQPTTTAKATITIGQTTRPEMDAQRRSMAETLR
jgi:hypothetical protein